MENNFDTVSGTVRELQKKDIRLIFQYLLIRNVLFVIKPPLSYLRTNSS